MPCYDPDSAEVPRRLAEKVNRLTEMLCWLCAQSSPDVIAGHSHLAEWWKKHLAHHARIAALKAKVNKLGHEALTNQERMELAYDSVVYRE